MGSLMPGWESTRPGVPPPGMEDYDDNNGKSKESGGYLATYARLKSLRHESLSPEQARVAAAAAAEEESASPRAAAGSQPAPAALARAASLSRRPSLKPAAAQQMQQPQQPKPASSSAYHPVLLSHSMPAAGGMASSPFASAAGTGASGRSSLDAAHSPRATAMAAGSHGHADQQHERWWARMDSAGFNAPQGPGPLDPAPARYGSSSYSGRRASSPGAGGFFGEADEGVGGGGGEGAGAGTAAPPRLWSPYSLRRRSTGGGPPATE